MESSSASHHGGVTRVSISTIRPSLATGLPFTTPNLTGQIPHHITPEKWASCSERPTNSPNNTTSQTQQDLAGSPQGSASHDVSQCRSSHNTAGVPVVSPSFVSPSAARAEYFAAETLLRDRQDNPRADQPDAHLAGDEYQLTTAMAFAII